MQVFSTKYDNRRQQIEFACSNGHMRHGISLLEVVVTLALVGTLASLVGDVFLQFSRIQISSDKSTAAVTAIPEVFTLINQSLHSMTPLSQRDKETSHRIDPDSSAKPSASTSPRYFLQGTDEELMMAVESQDGTANLHSFSSGTVASANASMALRRSGATSVTGEFVPAHSHHVVVSAWDSDGPSDPSRSATASIVELFAQPADIRFEYFDGSRWFSTWDSSINGSLPVLVRVSVSAPQGADGPDWFAPVVCSLRLPPGIVHLAAEGQETRRSR